MTASRSAVDISTLQKFLETVGSYTEDLIFAPGIVNVIHHYTDLKGLQGIVENHDLWLTNSRYSNDDEELMHGYRIVREVINTELASTPDDLFKDYLRQVLAILESPAPEGVYICCFCQDGDLLSQWRGYGSNGTGVSLAFLASGFSYVTGPDSPPRGLVRLWRVFYSTATQQNIIRQALYFGNAQPLPTPAERARMAADAILFFIPTFKNEDFEEEKEIRLIFTPEAGFAEQPKFRISRGMLVPYYSLKEISGTSTPPTLPIDRVRIGPSMNKNVNAGSVRMMLNKAGYPAVGVDVSNTPYRG